MSEGLEAVVSSLRAQTTMMIDILKDIQLDMKDIQQDIKSNYMPSAQVEERFKTQSERISRLQIDVNDMKIDINDRFKALSFAANEESIRKRDTPFKTTSMIVGIISIVGSCTAVLFYIVKSLQP